MRRFSALLLCASIDDVFFKVGSSWVPLFPCRVLGIAWQWPSTAAHGPPNRGRIWGLIRFCRLRSICEGCTPATSAKVGGWAKSKLYFATGVTGFVGFYRLCCDPIFCYGFPFAITKLTCRRDPLNGIGLPWTISLACDETLCASSLQESNVNDVTNFDLVFFLHSGQFNWLYIAIFIPFLLRLPFSHGTSLLFVRYPLKFSKDLFWMISLAFEGNSWWISYAKAARAILVKVGGWAEF